MPDRGASSDEEASEESASIDSKKARSRRSAKSEMESVRIFIFFFVERIYEF